MKLYKHVSRFLVRRQVHRWAEKRLVWALSLKAGDIINDCTSFNVVVRSIKPQRCRVGRGWFIYNVDICHEPFGGYCSLMNCGVERAKPRDMIEKEHLEYMANYMNSEGPGSASFWFGGRDNEDFLKSDLLWKRRLESVQGGGHFLDDRGVLLSEFRSA